MQVSMTTTRRCLNNYEQMLTRQSSEMKEGVKSDVSIE